MRNVAFGGWQQLIYDLAEERIVASRVVLDMVDEVDHAVLILEEE